IPLEPKFFTESYHLDRQVVVDETELIAQGAEIFVLPQQAAQYLREADNHDSRLGRVRADQRGDAVQRVEEKMRGDLVGQGRQARLHQQPLLLLELSLIARVVPDLQRDGDRKERRRIIRGQRQRRRVPAGQKVNLRRREGLVQDLAQKLRHENSGEKLQVKRR